MADSDKGSDRREFLRTGLGVAAGAALLSTSSASSGGRKTVTPGVLPVRKLGGTGLALPVLGFGGSAFVKAFRQFYRVPVLDEEERVRLVRSAYEKGIRYYDTAPVYNESESVIGRALADVRDDVYLATKVEAIKPEEVRPMVETSLERLRTDVLDCVQIHGLPGIENMTVSQAMQIHAELVKLRDEGLFRFIGLTGHTAFDKMYEMISSGGFDTVLLGHGYIRKGWNTLLSHRMLEQREMCLAKAHELGMGIVAMKALGGWLFGHDAATYAPDGDSTELAALPGAAIRYVLQEDRFHLLLIGMCVPSDLEQAIATVSGDWTLTNRDRQRLADFAARVYAHPAITKYRVT